jgi:hypothetical protein
MSNINQLVLEAAKKPGPPKRFRPKVRRVNIKKQRSIYAGQAAASISRKINPALAARKKMYRKMYLDIKKREQQMYAARARAMSMRR